MKAEGSHRRLVLGLNPLRSNPRAWLSLSSTRKVKGFEELGSPRAGGSYVLVLVTEMAAQQIDCSCITQQKGTFFSERSQSHLILVEIETLPEFY